MTREEAIKILKDCELNPCVPQDKEAVNLAIKALEQEPCEDAVSRQAVIKVAKDWWDNGVLAIDDIYKLPPVEPTQKWIPCSERLPKADEYNGDVAKYYLVQNEYGDMLVARYTHSNYWEGIYQLKPISDEIVAWMPLPEPYKADNRTEQGLAYADQDTMMSAT